MKSQRTIEECIEYCIKTLDGNLNEVRIDVSKTMLENVLSNLRDGKKLTDFVDLKLDE